MSTSYSLDLATSVTAPQVAREVLDVARAVGLFDPSVGTEQVLGEGATTGTALWFHVGTTREVPWGNPVATDFGFTPTVSVGFQQSLSRDSRDQQDDVVRASAGLLARISGDAVLHYQFEDIWLLRLGAELFLNERDGLWPPGRLSLIPSSYRRKTYAFSEED